MSDRLPNAYSTLQQPQQQQQQQSGGESIHGGVMNLSLSQQQVCVPQLAIPFCRISQKSN
jgi:hypothetical protein